MAGEDVHIIVGCGGSGIRTVRRLNELLAEDPYWRTRVDTDICYLLMDTDQADLNEFDAAVNQQLQGTAKPITKYIHLAQGLSSLRPLVSRYLVKPFSGAGVSAESRGRERLYEHWWSSRPQHPYSAPDVTPLNKGAGQCPPVASFLTWWSLPRIEETVRELIDEILARRGGSRLNFLNFSIVAGLSGGTGRGSWQLVAFKLREVFEREGLEASAPVAFLYDCGVHHDIMKRNPNQAHRMRANSLTGVSELSCWMGNIHQGKMFHYTLPNMKKPEDPDLDVLRADLDLGAAVESRSTATPVDNAYLIFKSSGKSVLANHEQYHEMVGAGLYAALTKSDVSSQAINEKERYYSLASATFEVNAHTLREYFEKSALIKAVNQLRSYDRERVDGAISEALKAGNLRINVTARDRSGFQPDEKGTILQRVCQALLGQYENEMASLDQALERDDVEEVIQAVAAIVRENERAVEAALEEVIGNLGETPEDVVAAQVRNLYEGTRSAANVQALLKGLISELETELEGMPGRRRMQASVREDPVQLARDLSTRPWKVWGRHYDDGECDEIRNRTLQGILFANYGAIRDCLETRYKGWMDALRSWRTNAGVVVDRCEKLTGKFSHERRAIVPGIIHDADLFDALFTDADEPERGISGKFAMKRFYRRDLKPVVKRGEELEILGDVQFGSHLNELVVDAVLEKELSADAYGEKETLARNLENEIRREVHLPEDFIRENFSIRKVISDQRHAWIHRIDQTGSAARRNELSEQFESFFGATFTRQGEEYTLPEPDALMLEMGASLASTCVPFWQLEGVEEISHRVSLFLPVPDSKLRQEDAEKTVQNSLRNRASVSIQGQKLEGTGEEMNPFVLLAYSTDGIAGEVVPDQPHPLEPVASLDYWRQDADVNRTMVACEDPDGQSVISLDVGFTDPMYVRDKQLRALRWAPWAEEGEVEKNESIDALLYALLEPDAGLQARLDEFDWEVPLIRDAGQKRYVFSRIAYKWQDQKAVPDPHRPWKADQQVARGISQVFDVLSGKGDSQGRLLDEGPQWRARILRERDVFWREVLPQVANRRERTELLREFQQKLGERLPDAANDDNRAIWEAMIQRIDAHLEA